MRKKRTNILMAAFTALIYMVVLLVMEDDYSQAAFHKVLIQGVIFAVVFGIAIWLLDRYKNRRKKRE